LAGQKRRNNFHNKIKLVKYYNQHKKGDKKMPELNVSRKNISKLFSEMQDKKYIIPDYQRPYKWDEEKCEILWNDITTFFLDKKDNEEYFLGTIVTCKGEDHANTIEIIDGQQRITSLFLLLRAFYKKLEIMQEDENIIGLKSQIAPCLWNVDPISRKVKDKSKIHIESKVATENDNNVFHEILKTGNVDEQIDDLYTTNYSFFYKKCEEYARDNPIYWQPLCVTILEKCIVLPIECENVDTALTIFSTLNDRGMPLSDADIFKAQIYRTKNTDEGKKEFTDNWKELTETVEDSKLSLDDLFRYYSHIIRAKNNDKSKEIGLRKFYASNNHSKLKEPELITDLIDLAEFWFSLNTGESKINDIEKISVESRKYLHCLQCYPNEYWKYITSVFFYKNKDNENFIDIFPPFLKKLTAFLYAKFVEKPTVNAIKNDIYQGYIDVYHDNQIKFAVSIKDDQFKKLVVHSGSLKIAKGMILLHAYQNPKQQSLIPNNFEVEHIFPRVWQTANYNGWSKLEADEYLEKYGNKVAIEKKVNIHAGNGYFGRKKIKYQASKISEVIDLSNYSKNDWVKDDIIERENNFSSAIFNFINDNITPLKL
jgi:uncharacterized protein with ParB-like and HNH nuclease domain